jgi:hypothetical protein
MVGTMFVSMRQYFGEPIECLAGPSDIPPAMLQHYCWLEATFSVAESDGKAVVGDHVAYPGVKVLDEQRGEHKVYHKYYQWVYFVLIIQSILFYTPKQMWRTKEAKRLKVMITELRQKHVKQMTENDKRRLTQDLVDSLLLSNDYYGFFIFCEFLCLLHLIAQIWFVNIFLSGQFLRLGLEWLYYSHDDQPAQQDPLIRVFPRMTKCLFHKYGYSGSIEKHDALCFLPLNIVNEKLYVVLWFWFAFLLIFTALVLLQRLALVLLPPLRFRKVRAVAPNTKKKLLRRLTSRMGNFFILHTVASNMKPSHFRDLIQTTVDLHFDEDCNLMFENSTETVVSQVSQKPMQKISAEAPKKAAKMGSIAAPIKGYKQSKGKASKNSFVVVNRDPPSGHSGDSDGWNH